MEEKIPASDQDGELVSTGIRSLRELIEIVSGRSLKDQQPAEDHAIPTEQRSCEEIDIHDPAGGRFGNGAPAPRESGATIGGGTTP